MKSKLAEKTLELLNNRSVKLKFKDIANATGVPEGWIKVFNTGTIKEPSVVRVEKLYEFLASKSLEV